MVLCWRVTSVWEVCRTFKWWNLVGGSGSLGVSLALRLYNLASLSVHSLLPYWEGLLLLPCFSLQPASQKKPFLHQIASCWVPWKVTNAMHSFLSHRFTEVPGRHNRGQGRFISSLAFRGIPAIMVGKVWLRCAWEAWYIKVDRERTGLEPRVSLSFEGEL